MLTSSSPANSRTISLAADTSIDPAMIIKSQRVSIDTVDAADVVNRTSGKLFVNGLVERPVLFTSLSDDNIFLPGTILSQFYSNGSADTNNDGGLTTVSALLEVEEAAHRSKADYWQAVYRVQTSYAGVELATGTLSPGSPVVTQ